MKPKRFPFNVRPAHAALILAGLLCACGGGSDSPPAGGPGPGSGSDRPADHGDEGLPDEGAPGGGGNEPGSGAGGDDGLPPPPASPTMMACPDAAPDADSVVQCSGEQILRADHGVGASRSGVQAWARSTRDEAVTAHGLAPATFDAGMTAEIRIARDPSTGRASNPALLLDRLGLSWDGRNERPPIIDTFHAGGESRVVLGAKREINRIALPPSSDLAFYDYATRGAGATQAHYANNVYFPRSPDNPARCPPQIDPGSIYCSTESTGLQNGPAGDWRNGGTGPDQAEAVRFHGDSDVHAGNAASGDPPILPGGSGLGAPFPGSKGYRTLEHLGYRYANLGAWFTQDGVGIVEWTLGPGSDEHNKNRRGIVTFGDVTDPATVPPSGTVTYSGQAYSWHSATGAEDPARHRGPAMVTVDFANRLAEVTLPDARPGGIRFTVQAQGGEWANLLTGSIGVDALGGGASARYFGPVASGTGGTGPAEFGGAFALGNATTGEAMIGGFIAVKR